MRVTLCGAVLAVCLIALQCTADDDGEPDTSGVKSDGSGLGHSPSLSVPAGSQSVLASSKDLTTTANTEPEDPREREDTEHADLLLTSDREPDPHPEQDRTEKPNTPGLPAAPKGSTSTSSEDPEEGSVTHLKMTLTLPKTRGTPTNGDKTLSSPNNNHTNKPGAPNTPTTAGKAEAPPLEEPTDIAKSNPDVTVTLPKETPPAPKAKDLSGQQALSTPSLGNKGPSTDKNTQEGRVVTPPLPPVSQLKPNVAPSGKEQSPPPAITAASGKNKGTTKDTTTTTTTGAPAKKGLVPQEKPEPTLSVAADNMLTTTGTTITKNKETIPLEISVSSTMKPKNKDSALPADTVPNLAKALQSLDNKDSSMGRSSLFALAAFATFFLMAIAPAF